MDFTTKYLVHFNLFLIHFWAFLLFIFLNTNVHDYQLWISSLLESPFYTNKYVLKINLTHNGFIWFIHHSLIIV